MAIARNLKSQAMWRRDPRPASSSHRSSKFSDAEPKFFVVKSNDEGPKMTTNKVGGIFWIKDYPSTEIRRWPKFDKTLQLNPSDESKKLTKRQWGGFWEISNMAEWSSDAHLTRGRWAGGAGRERTARHCGTVAEQTSCHHWAGKFKSKRCDL